MTFFDECDKAKRDQLFTFYHLKYGWSIFIIEQLMKMSEDAGQFIRNVEAADNLSKVLLKKEVA